MEENKNNIPETEEEPVAPEAEAAEEEVNESDAAEAEEKPCKGEKRKLKNL